jgi:hypothetical protein
MQHPQHIEAAILVVTSEANAPVALSQSVLGRLDTNQARHVTISGLCEVLYRINHAAPNGGIKSL